MIIIIPTIKYGSTYYNTFKMGVCSNNHGYFFQWVDPVFCYFVAFKIPLCGTIATVSSFFDFTCNVWAQGCLSTTSKKFPTEPTSRDWAGGKRSLKLLVNGFYISNLCY